MQLNFPGMEQEPEPSGVKARLAQILSLVRVSYQYGFIPYVIYLGKNSCLIIMEVFEIFV